MVYIFKDYGVMYYYNSKTASTSIKRSIQKRSNVVETLKRRSFKYFYNKYPNYKIFTFIRNPFDRVVSFYHFSKPNNNNYNFNEFIQKKYIDDPKIRKDKDIQLRPFIHKEKIRREDIDKLFFIGRFENLTEDFNTLCSMIGIEVGLLHINKTNRKNYREYFDDRSRKIIEKWYKEDLEVFGYEF